jgi:hypothetical protein
MEESEGKWEFRHEENVLWTASITNMVAEINNENRREVQREIQEAKGITDMDLETNPDVIDEVQILTERVINQEMNAQRPQMEASRHAPTIPPAVPIVRTTPKTIQFRGREKPTLIAPPQEHCSGESA